MRMCDDWEGAENPLKVEGGSDQAFTFEHESEISCAYAVNMTITARRRRNGVMSLTEKQEKPARRVWW